MIDQRRVDLADGGRGQGEWIIPPPHSHPLSTTVNLKFKHI